MVARPFVLWRSSESLRLYKPLIAHDAHGTVVIDAIPRLILGGVKP
jgi:hypothetical protein